MKYERSITSGLEVMAKVKVFVHATDADADGRAMTLAPRTYMSRLAKNYLKTRHVFVKHGCPRRQQSQNMAKISKSYILTPPHPRGM